MRTKAGHRRLSPSPKVTRVELRAEAAIACCQIAEMAEFTIPKVVDHEVAALHSRR